MLVLTRRVKELELHDFISIEYDTYGSVFEKILEIKPKKYKGVRYVSTNPTSR